MSATKDHDSDGEVGNSSDEALCEMLGLKSLDTVILGQDDSQPTTRVNPTLIVEECNLAAIYSSESMCLLPKSLSISSALMRRLTDELVWGGDSIKADRTYENIKVMKASGEIVERRTLTRLENFVRFHREWKELCHGHLAGCISALFNEPMVLYKEKLNLKPPGGSGFAPHLDTPSLRVALGKEGPQTFVTVMVAIDNMTAMNGCLRVSRGEWSESQHCEVIQPNEGDNPDSGGRAGAIPLEVAQDLNFDNIECQGGDILVFNGWAPHRSAPNASPFPRRAVFLTYNPESEGDFHERYYQRMSELRSTWRENVGLGAITKLDAEEKMELDALSTIPRI